MWPANRIVSGLFTAWDRLTVEPQRAALSAAAWHVITDRAYRTRIHAAGTGHGMPIWLLLRRPLTTDTAVAVPVGGQAHAAPWARWGHVTTEATSIHWDTTQAATWSTYQRLREHVGRDALERPAPPYQAIARLDPTQRRLVMGLWPHLDPWRRQPEIMTAAHRVHRDQRRHEKETDG